MLKNFILISCIIVLLAETGNAARPLTPPVLDPSKCAQSFPKAAVCWTEKWTSYGKPSPGCCKALQEIDAACLPSVFPANPFYAPFLKSLCSAPGGGAGGGSPFPPFPFTPIGGGAGGLPLPFPFPGVANAPPPKA